MKKTLQSFLAVDLDIGWIATTVNSKNLIKNFMEKSLWRVKGHYFWL